MGTINNYSAYLASKKTSSAPKNSATTYKLSSVASQSPAAGTNKSPKGTDVLSSSPAESQSSVIAIPNSNGGYDYYYNPQSADTPASAQQVQGNTPQQTFANIVSSGGGVTIHSKSGSQRRATPKEINQMALASVVPEKESVLDSPSILTDVKAGQETYKITRGPALSRFVATQGREGLPFTLLKEEGEGDIGYRGRHYTTVEHAGKTYVIQSGRELTAGEKGELGNQLNGASPSYMMALGVVDVVNGGDPFAGNNSRYGTQLLYESGAPSGVYAKPATTEISAPVNLGYSFYDEKTGQQAFIEYNEKYLNENGLPNYGVGNNGERTNSKDYWNNNRGNIVISDVEVSSRIQQQESQGKSYPFLISKAALDLFGISGAFGIAYNANPDQKQGATLLDAPIFKDTWIKKSTDTTSEWFKKTFSSQYKGEEYFYKDPNMQQTYFALFAPAIIPKILFKPVLIGTTGLQVGVTAINPTKENIANSVVAVSTLAIPKTISVVKNSYNLATGRYIPEAINDPILRDISTPEPINFEVQTQARTFKNLQLETQPKTVLTYEQTFKRPFFGKEKALVILEKYPLSKQVTKFRVGGVDYELTKFPELKTTEIFKQGTYKGDVLFNKKLPAEELSFDVKNMQHTVPLEGSYKLSESQVTQLQLQESLFDISANYGGRKIKGFGKAQRVTKADSEADYSRIVRSKTYLQEETPQQFATHGYTLKIAGKEYNVMESMYPTADKSTTGGFFINKEDLYTDILGYKRGDMYVNPYRQLQSSDTEGILAHEFGHKVDLELLGKRQKFNLNSKEKREFGSIFNKLKKEYKKAGYDKEEYANEFFADIFSKVKGRSTSFRQFDMSEGLKTKLEYFYDKRKLGGDLSIKEGVILERAPFLESGKTPGWVPSVKKRILDGESTLEIKETILEIGKPKYWQDLKTKNYQEQKIDQRILQKEGIEFDPNKIQKVRKTRITRKGQVNTKINQLTNLKIKFASGKNIKKIYQRPRKVPEVRDIQVPENNVAPDNPKLEDLSWLKGRKKDEIELFEQKVSDMKKNLEEKGVSQNNINKAVSSEYVKNYPKSKISKLELESMNSPDLPNLDIFSESKNGLKGGIAVLPKLQPLPQIENPIVRPRVKTRSMDKVVQYPKPRSEMRLKNIPESRNKSKPETKQNLHQEMRQEIRQEIRQEQKQEIRQQQRQRQKQEIRQEIRTNLRIGFRVPGGPGIPRIPKIKLPKIRSLSKFTRPIKQLKAPTPTAYALSLGMEGKMLKSGTTSGLGLRPLDFSRIKRRRL